MLLWRINAVTSDLGLVLGCYLSFNLTVNSWGAGKWLGSCYAPAPGTALAAGGGLYINVLNSPENQTTPWPWLAMLIREADRSQAPHEFFWPFWSGFVFVCSELFLWKLSRSTKIPDSKLLYKTNTKISDSLGVDRVKISQPHSLWNHPLQK